MSAERTALAVVEWALGDATGTAPPTGPLRDCHTLADPDPALGEALRALCAITAARMRLEPNMRTDGPIGVGGALLAAAIGGRGASEQARLLLTALPPATNTAERIVRHGVLFPALRYLPRGGEGSELIDDCLRSSPLTALADRPVDGMRNELLERVSELAAHPAGRRWLVLLLAKPTEHTAVREWRQRLMSDLRLSDDPATTSLVLDVYEALAIHHRERSLDQVRKARAVLQDPLASGDENRARDALSVAAWWQPLWELRREDNDALRRRLYLGYDYLEGVELCTLARNLTGGPLGRTSG